VVSGAGWREDVTRAAGRLFAEWDIEALPSQFRRNNLDYYYLSVWPGLADLRPAGELRLPPRPARTESAYIHLPFCSGLCDFCSYFVAVSHDTRSDPRVPAYLDGLIAQARLHQASTELGLSYLYLGGGTPSLLHPGQLAYLLGGLSRLGVLSPELIGTVELHPEVFGDPARLEDLLAVVGSYGIKRVSLGFQSHDSEVLDGSNRRHGAAFLDAAMTRLHGRGLMVNIDLMYGLPGQPMESWVRSLELALAARPDSVSTYFTFIDPGTRLWRRARREPGILAPHGQIQLQHLAAQIALERAGYTELPSDFYSKPPGDPAGYTQETLPSDANMVALGAGAYGYYPGVQFFNHFDFRRYGETVRAGQSPIWRAAVLTPEQELCRDIMFSFKNAPALSIPLFAARHGVSPLDSHPATFARLAELGLATAGEREIRLTPKGRLVVEEIACAFAPPRPAAAGGPSGQEAALISKHHFAPGYGTVTGEGRGG
jgi:oxygen-independent coproporphyrinogen III oxidase